MLYFNDETGEWYTLDNDTPLDASGNPIIPTGTAATSVGSAGWLKGIQDLLKGVGFGGTAGQLLGTAGIAALLNKIAGGSGSTGPTGYQGGIPVYNATRTQLPLPYSSTDQARLAQAAKDSLAQGLTMDQVKQGAQQKFGIAPAEVEAAIAATPPPYRRPGAGGITYFSPMQYSYTGKTAGSPQDFIPPPAPTAKPLASGGIAMLAKGGRFLQGAGDGVSDSIPATIGNTRPARLADGEFVIDARTVSEIGNGSSNAGAKKLYAMMDRVHKERRKATRGKPSKADKYLPR